MLKRLQGFIIGFMVCAFLLSGIAYAAVQQFVLTQSTTKITLDGTELKNATLPVLNYKGEYNYLPAALFRDICAKIGVGFEWNGTVDEIQLTSLKVSSVTQNTLPESSLDGLIGIIHNDVFYISLDGLAQTNYNVVVTKKDSDYIIISTKTGQSIVLKLDIGYVMDGDTPYFNYPSVKYLLIENVPVPTPTPTPIDTSNLKNATQDGLTGVTANGVFFVEMNSFMSMYNAHVNGMDTIVILPSTDRYTVMSTYDGKNVVLKINEGCIKNDKGVYFKFDSLKGIIGG